MSEHPGRNTAASDPVAGPVDASPTGTSDRSFGLTFDYRCPFARNLHEHVVTALRGGADWDVSFVPFSLNQVHVGEGEPDVWDDPSRARDLLALQVGVAIRDGWPEHFLRTHIALFAARHDRGLDLRDEDAIRKVLKELGLEADSVFEAIAGGTPLVAVRREHEQAVTAYEVFGVPTVILDGRAAFVRVMDRPEDDSDRATATIARLLDTITGWPALNELKYTTIPR